MSTEDFETPASPDLYPGDAGLDGAEASLSLAPAPGDGPRPARGGLPGSPDPGSAAHPPVPTPVAGGCASTSPPPLAPTLPGLGGGDRGGGDGGPSGGVPASPSPLKTPASDGNAVSALAGQDWRDAVRAEQVRQAKARRNQRGRRPVKVPGRKPGMVRRMPDGPGDAA